MLWRDFLRVIYKELLLYYRSKGECLTSLLFYLIIAALFPLTLAIDPQRLPTLAPGVIWVAALLASVLSLGQLFRDDFADGSLAQCLLGPLPSSMLVLAKIIAHWLIYSLPLLLVTPLLALMFHLPAYATFILLLTLLLATPILQSIGAFIAALTVGLRQSSVLLAILLLPLFVPSLIFACGAVEAARLGGVIAVPLLLLSALLVLVVTVMPMLTAIALRISVNYEN